MVRGTISKYIYIDSSVNTHNDHTRVLMPAHPFSAQGNERMSLTLLSFGMRRSFHNINPTNGIFYLYVNTTYSATLRCLLRVLLHDVSSCSALRCTAVRCGVAIGHVIVFYCGVRTAPPQ